MNPAVRTTIDGAVATVTLCRPESLNAITREMLVELTDQLDALASDRNARVVVLTGEGRAFSAGVDLKALGRRSLHGGAVGDVLDGPARRAIALLTTMAKPVIAKINGYCFTGALELALACDLIVVSRDATLGDTHAKFGLRPTWGMSQRLIRAIGLTRARELSLTARTFTGAEAALWGLATRAVPAGELDESVRTLSQQLLANSPGSLAAYKDLYRVALEHGLAEGLQYEAEASYPITDTEDRIAGFR